LNRVDSELQYELGRDATVAELAAELSVDEATIVQWRIWGQSTLSLDEGEIGDNTWDLNDYVPDDAPPAFDLVSLKISQQEIRDLLDVLTDDERTLITMRFFEDPPKTSKEISRAIEAKTARHCKKCGTMFTPPSGTGIRSISEQKKVHCLDCQPKNLAPGVAPLNCRICHAEFIPSIHLKKYCSVKCQSVNPYYHSHLYGKLLALEYSAMHKLQAKLAEQYIDTGDVFLYG
jgi:hypothetical protein